MSADSTSIEKNRTPSDRNEVLLVGRVSAAPQQRFLPSGDSVTSLRVVVRRQGPRPRPNAPTVDTLECSAWTPRIQRTMEKFVPGDVVEVTGSLRRRFQHVDGGSISRYEIEVSRAKRITRAAAA